MNPKSNFYILTFCMIFAPMVIALTEYSRNKNLIIDATEIENKEFKKTPVNYIKINTIDHGVKSLEFKVDKRYYEIIPDSSFNLNSEKQYFLSKEMSSNEIVLENDSESLSFKFRNNQKSMVKTILGLSIATFILFGSGAIYYYRKMNKTPYNSGYK